MVIMAPVIEKPNLYDLIKIKTEYLMAISLVMIPVIENPHNTMSFPRLNKVTIYRYVLLFKES